MSVIQLSICIPTYNYGDFISETIHSVLDQLEGNGVEVIVLDGASTDNTFVVMQEIVPKHSQVKYFRLEKRGGIDADMARSVELASGDYCWLFSSDDLMMPGAVKKILYEIEQGHDIYLCKHLNCNLDMKHIYGEHPVLNLNKDTVFDLSDPKERLRYFELAQTTEAFFSFMGSIIIKRDKWNSVPLDERFIGSCWAHVARIFAIMKNGCTLKYLAAPYLKKREENSSFAADKGIVNRLRIGIDGYRRLGDVFFGHNSTEAIHLRRAVRNEIPLLTFIHVKMLCRDNPDSEDIHLLHSLVRKNYETDVLKYIIYRISPVWLYSAIRHIYKYTRTRSA
jgi:abequosyltransferase